MTWTVLGAEGFLGRWLVRSLRASGEPVAAMGRNDALPASLGDVVDCVGITSDFRARTTEVFDAHVGRVAALLSGHLLDSYLYLSSTRVYRRAASTLEDEPLRLDPSDPEDVYGISKVAGESLTLAGPPTFRVARLANVVSPDPADDTFLRTIVDQAVRSGHVEVRVDRAYVRDLVHVEDVVAALPRIVSHGRSRIYNIASGVNRTASDVVDAVAQRTGASATFADGGLRQQLPAISIERARADLGFAPRDALTVIPDLLDALQDGA